MKYVKRFLGTIIMVFLIGILFVSGVILINTYKDPDKIPSFFGWKPFIVLSGSMETEIMTGDLVIVKEIEPEILKENDIIAFKDHENYVVIHRIVKKIDEGGNIKFITKGDNNNTEDNGYVEKESIEGIYKCKITGLGEVLLIMQKPSTLIITLILILIGGILCIKIDDNNLTEEKKEN